MERLKQLLGNQRGAMGISSLFLVMFLLLLSVVVYEFMRVHITVAGVRNAFEDSLVSVANENVDTTYGGTRQGYSGGYFHDAAGWTPQVTEGDVYSKLDHILHTAEVDDGHEYAPNGNVVYRLTDLTIDISNKPHAMGNEGDLFSLTGTVVVTVPFQFGWNALPPIQLTIAVRSGLQGG